MRKKIFVITDTGWWDTDQTVLPYLTDFFDIEANLIAAKDNNKFTEESVLKFEKENGITVKIIRRFKRIRNLNNLLTFFKLFISISKKQNNYSLINYIYIYDPYINLIALLFNPKKLIVSIHDYDDHPGLKNQLRGVIKKAVIKRAQFFHFYSENERDKFIKDFPDKKTFYTPMPLKSFGSIDPFVPALFDRGSAKKVFLFMGFIRYYKGLDILINAITKLNRSDYVLVIAGAADDWAEYEQSVANLPQVISNIGFIEDSDIANYVSHADFLVLPYRSATQSGPALIAMNYNLPIIASDLDCFKSVIDDGIDGFLFAKENEDELCLTIERALNLSTEQYLEMKHNQLLKAQVYKDKESKTGDTFDNFVKQNLVFIDKTDSLHTS